MSRVFFLIAFLLCASVCEGAVANDIRWSDNDGDVADITPAGLLMVSTTNTPGDGSKKNQHDKRISDNSGDVADLTSSGALRLSA